MEKFKFINMVVIKVCLNKPFYWNGSSNFSLHFVVLFVFSLNVWKPIFFVSAYIANYFKRKKPTICRAEDPFQIICDLRIPKSTF